MGPSVLQFAANSSGGTAGPTIGKAFASAVIAGSGLLAFVNWGATSGTVKFIDDTVNGPGGWQRVPNSNVVDAAGPQQGEFWFLPRTGDGIPTITANFSANQTFCGIVIHEIAAGADVGMFIEAATASAVETASTTFNSSNLTPSRDGCLLIGATTNSTNSTLPSAASPFTIVVTSTSNQIVGTESQVQGAAASTHAAFTYSGAVTGTVHFVIIRPVLAGPMRPALARQLR